MDLKLLLPAVVRDCLLYTSHKQAKKVGVKFKLTDVRAVQLEGDTKVVETFRTNYECRSVIIASGGKPRLTGAPGEDKFPCHRGICPHPAPL